MFSWEGIRSDTSLGRWAACPTKSLIREVRDVLAWISKSLSGNALALQDKASRAKTETKPWELGNRYLRILKETRPNLLMDLFSGLQSYENLVIQVTAIEATTGCLQSADRPSDVSSDSLISSNSEFAADIVSRQNNRNNLEIERHKVVFWSRSSEETKKSDTGVLSDITIQKWVQPKAAVTLNEHVG